MGRPKGGENKKWSKDEKLRIVHRYFNENMGYRVLAKEEGIPYGTLYNWIQGYLKDGELSFESKTKPGNRFTALHTSKSLGEVERLRLIVAKQEIEIERLKKGYTVKGVGASKVFVTTKDVSLKS